MHNFAAPTMPNPEAKDAQALYMIRGLSRYALQMMGNVLMFLCVAAASMVNQATFIFARSKQFCCDKEKMKKIAIIGSGMMGSALAFPARENGNEVRLVGTPLDRDIIDACRRTGQHLKFDRPFPEGVKYYQFEQWREAVKGVDFVIGGVSSFGVDWFLTEVLEKLDPEVPVISVTKGLMNLDDGTLVSYPEYWQRELAKKGIIRTINAIGGPCTSYELVFHDQTQVASASGHSPD